MYILKKNIRTDNDDITKDTPLVNFLIEKRINQRHLGSFSHVAAFVTDKFLFNEIAPKKIIIGENSDKPLNAGCKIKIHAEMDALQRFKGKLKCRKIKKNKINKVDLIVLRVNKNGCLCESAPCYHCTKELIGDNIININNLYFSKSDGTIICIKFNDWIELDSRYISKGWKWYIKTKSNKNEIIKL